MANDNFPRGLVPLRWPFTSGNWYRVGTAADLFIGMPVELASTGYIGPVPVDSAGAVQTIGVVMQFAGTQKRGLATNDPFLDVSDLVPPDPTSDTGDRFAFVVDDPDAEFVMQGDTGGTLATLADVGQAVVGIYRSAGSGNTSTGWASLEIDASSNVASNSGFFQLLRLHDIVNQDGTENTAGANYAKWVGRLLHHQKRSGLNPIPA